MKETQRVKILKYLREYGSITPLEALREFSCMRLATRIFELKEDGYKIKTVIEKAENKSGEPVHYARYYLQEDK
jgi:hypothetical protein